MSTTRIAIIGAGPVGLALARLLHGHINIELTIFESDKSRDVRSQGGSLDLHPDTGLAVMKEAGLWDSFLKHVRYDGEAVTILDKHLNNWFRLSASKESSIRDRPEIDRKALREILLDSVPSELIRWGCRLREIDENHNLIFDHGTEFGFDLVVGADGAWSKTRKVISDQRPEYAGLGGYIFKIPNAETIAPGPYKLTNRGTVFALSDSRAIFSQQIGDGSLYIAAWFQRPENWQDTTQYAQDDLESIKKSIREEFHDWHPELREFVELSDESMPISLYQLPVGWRWDNRPGVTLIGDAAHLMTPFGGVGVNLGMQDALLLSRAIINAAKSSDPKMLTANIKDFEEDMFVRAESAAAMTRDMLNWMMFADGTPRTVIDKWMLRILTFHDRTWFDYLRYPLLAGCLKLFFFYKRVIYW